MGAAFFCLGEVPDVDKALGVVRCLSLTLIRQRSADTFSPQGGFA